jgi:hypothetical protein
LAIFENGGNARAGDLSVQLSAYSSEQVGFSGQEAIRAFQH